MNRLLALLFLLPTLTYAATIDNVQPGYWAYTSSSDADQIDPCNGLTTCNWSGSLGFKALVDVWNGGIYNTTRDWVVLWGGGHNGYAGNEVIAFDVNTEQWTLLTNPADPVCGDCQYYPDGTPSAVHTYSHLQYWAQGDVMFSFTAASMYSGPPGGAGASISTARSNAFDFNTNTWSAIASLPGSASGLAGSATAYDPTDNVYYHQMQAGQPVREYNPVSDSWRDTGGTGGVPLYMTAAVDPTRDIMVITGNGRTSVFDLSSANPGSTQINDTDSGDLTIKNASGPGFVYDPVADQFVGWAGGTTVYTLDPATLVWSAVNDDPGNSIDPGAPNSNNTYGRFRYVPNKNAYVLVNATNKNVYYYKLTSGSPGADQDWVNRSTAAGVISATRFDTQAEVDDWVHSDSGTSYVSWDQATKISGNGSLRMDILDTAATNSGNWRRWLADDQREFNSGDTIYVQYQAYMSSGYRTYDFAGGNGPKLSIVSRCAGDMDGTSCSPSGSNQFNEIVLQNTRARGILQGYNQDWEGSSPNWEVSRDTGCQNGDVVFQEEVDRGVQSIGTACENDRARYGGLYNWYNSNPVANYPDPITGAHLLPDGGWMTVYLKIVLGESSNVNTNDTVVTLSVTENGDPYDVIVNKNIDLGPGPPINAIWLTPFTTSRTAQPGARPDFIVRYDELIVSTQPIAAPISASSSLPSTPINPALSCIPTATLGEHDCTLTWEAGTP